MAHFQPSFGNAPYPVRGTETIRRLVNQLNESLANSTDMSQSITNADGDDGEFPAPPVLDSNTHRPMQPTHSYNLRPRGPLPAVTFSQLPPPNHPPSPLLSFRQDHQQEAASIKSPAINYARGIRPDTHVLGNTGETRVKQFPVLDIERRQMTQREENLRLKEQVHKQQAENLKLQAQAFQKQQEIAAANMATLQKKMADLMAQAQRQQSRKKMDAPNNPNQSQPPPPVPPKPVKDQATDNPEEEMESREAAEQQRQRAAIQARMDELRSEYEYWQQRGAYLIKEHDVKKNESEPDRPLPPTPPL